MTTIRKATAADAALVAPLFDACRQFYGKPSEPEPQGLYESMGWVRDEAYYQYSFKL